MDRVEELEGLCEERVRRERVRLEGGKETRCELVLYCRFGEGSLGCATRDARSLLGRQKTEESVDEQRHICRISYHLAARSHERNARTQRSHGRTGW